MVGDGLADDSLNERADELIEQLRNVGRPRLFVISGPSGVGKDTLIKQMRPQFPELHFAVTATTRARRPGEMDGIDYYFMTREEFLARLDAGDFLEAAEVYGKGHWYGVPKSRLRGALHSGRSAVVKVDVQGAWTIRQISPEAVLIFVAPPNMADLTRRLRDRESDDPVAIMHRLRTASQELRAAEYFDYVVFNETDRQEAAVDSIAAIVIAELARINQRATEL